MLVPNSLAPGLPAPRTPRGLPLFGGSFKSAQHAPACRTVGERLHGDVAVTAWPACARTSTVPHETLGHSRALLLYGIQTMLHYAVIFLVIALVAALFGFGGIAAGAVGIAKILFVVFLIAAVVTFIMNGRRTM